MKFGMTRWKIVPSYSATPCIFLCVVGLVQSFVPVDKPMKLDTPMGAFFGYRVQVIFPTVVSMMAIGSGAFSSAGAGFFAAAARCGGTVVAGLACAHADQENATRTSASPSVRCMQTP